VSLKIRMRRYTANHVAKIGAIAVSLVAAQTAATSLYAATDATHVQMPCGERLCMECSSGHCKHCKCEDNNTG
jgi:hypothetical protein